MSYASPFIRAATSGEAKLGKLLDEQERQLGEEQALDALQEQWDAAMDDGVIDAREAESLESFFDEAGLGDEHDELTKKIAGNGGRIDGQAAKDFDEAVDDKIKDGIAELGADDFMQQIQIQMAMNKVQQAYATASALLKAEHEIAMGIINNIKG